MVNSDVEIQTNVFLTVKSVMLLLTVRMVLMSPCLVVRKSSLPMVASVVAKKLGCRLKIKLRRLKEGVKWPFCFTDSLLAKNPAGNHHFFSRSISPAAST